MGLNKQMDALYVDIGELESRPGPGPEGRQSLLRPAVTWQKGKNEAICNH